jgi:hypothetical protein
MVRSGPISLRKGDDELRGLANVPLTLSRHCTLTLGSQCTSP